MSKLQPIYLMNVVLYFDSLQSLHNFLMVNSSCKQAITNLHIIPQRVTSTKLNSSLLRKLSVYFPSMQTLRCHLSLLNELVLPTSINQIYGEMTANRDNHSVTKWMKMCYKITIQTHRYSRIDYSQFNILRHLHLILRSDSYVSVVISCQQLCKLTVLKQIVIECCGCHLEELCDDIISSQISHLKQVSLKLLDITNEHLEYLTTLLLNHVTIGCYTHTLTELPPHIILLPHYGYLTITNTKKERINKLFKEYVCPLQLHVCCNNEKIDTFSICNTFIRSLFISGLQCTKQLILPTSLETLHLNQCELPPIDLTYFYLESMTIDSTTTDQITLPPTISYLTSIKSTIRTITNLHLVSLPQTKMISVAHSLTQPYIPLHLTELTFAGACVTTFPNIQFCSLHKLKIFRCYELQNITLPSTLTLLALGTCRSLTKVDTLNSPLKKLEILDCSKLDTFIFPSTIKSIFIGRNKQLLVSLHSSLRKLKAIQTIFNEELPNCLTRLKLHDCNTVSFTSLYSLQYLTLTSHISKSLIFPTSLQSLYITDCTCQSISLQPLSLLTNLVLHRCSQITSLNFPCTIQKADVMRCGSLELHCNQCTQLSDLRLGYTEIPSIILPTNLKNLTLAGITPNILNKAEIPQLFVKNN
ncbi:Leucine-rich repeat containing protein [Entamoeba marina]